MTGNLGGRGLYNFTTLTYSPWSSKNLIDWNWLKKYIQVGVDVTCMHTDFSGCDLSDFRDIATFKNGQFSLSIVHAHQKIQLLKIGSKNHASRC